MALPSVGPRGTLRGTMARIVLGLGSSHSPMLNMQPEEWPGYEERERAGYIPLLDRRGQPAAFDALVDAADPARSGLPGEAKPNAPEAAGGPRHGIARARHHHRPCGARRVDRGRRRSVRDCSDKSNQPAMLDQAQGRPSATHRSKTMIHAPISFCAPDHGLGCGLAFVIIPWQETLARHLVENLDRA